VPGGKLGPTGGEVARPARTGKVEACDKDQLRHVWRALQQGLSHLSFEIIAMRSLRAASCARVVGERSFSGRRIARTHTHMPSPQRRRRQRLKRIGLVLAGFLFFELLVLVGTRFLGR